MVYPTLTPIDPTFDEYGLPVLPPEDYPMRDVKFYPVVSSTNDQDRLSLIPQMAVHSKDGSPVLFNDSLMEYSPDIVAEYTVMFQSMLKYLYWIVNSIMAADPNTVVGGTDSVNFAYSIPLAAYSSGDTFVIAAYQGKPRNITVNTSFVSAEDGGSAHWNDASFGISPGMEIRAGDPWGSNRYLVKKIVASHYDGETTVQVDRVIHGYTTGLIFLCDRIQTDGFEQINVRRDLWTSRKTVVVGKMALYENDYIYELTNIDNRPTRIAEPYAWIYSGANVTRMGTMRIRHGHTDIHNNIVYVDMTNNYLNSFKTAGSHIYQEVGTDHIWHTFVNCSDIGEDITHVEISYCPELDYSKVAVEPTARVRTLKGCANCFRDWTDGVANISDAEHFSQDIYNNHWFCAQAHLGADVSQFNNAQGDCANYKCTRYVPMQQYPWKLSIRLLKKLILGKYEYSYQIMAGAPNLAFDYGAGAVPSLTWLSGQPFYNQYSSYSNRENRFHSLLGRLEDYTDLDEHPEHVGFKHLVVGAVLPDGTGILKQDNNYPEQSCPNGSPSFDDGTDWAEIHGWCPGVRYTGWTPPDNMSNAYGYSNLHCQSVMDKQLVIRNINMMPEQYGVTQYINGCAVMVQQEEGFVRAYIQVGRSNDLGTRPIQGAAKLINRISIDGDILSLQMSLGYDISVYFMSSESDGYKWFMTGGMTVEPTQDLKPLNIGSLNEHSAFGSSDAKVWKGDTVRIANLPDGLGDIRLQVLSVQAHGGDEPLPVVIVPGVEDHIEYQVGGAFSPTDTTTYQAQSIKFGYNNVELYGLRNMARGNMTFDSPDVCNGYFVSNSANPLYSGQVIPGQQEVANALIQYMISLAYMPNPNDLKYTVAYNQIGSTVRKTKQIVFTQSIAQYQGLPNIPLKACPDLGSPISFEMYVDNVTGYVPITLAMNGSISTGAYNYLVLPLHGTYTIVQVGSLYYCLLPVECWGYKIKISVSYTSFIPIDINQEPVGLGYPADYLAVRKKCDVIRMSLEGTQGQRVKEYIASDLGSYGPGYWAIECDQKGVFPPTQYFDSAGTLQTTTHDLSIQHLQRSGSTNGCSVDIAEDITTDVMIDRCNGSFVVDVSDWENGDISNPKWNDICIKGKFLETGSGISAHLLKGLRQTFRQLNTYTHSDWATGSTLALKAYNTVTNDMREQPFYQIKDKNHNYYAPPTTFNVSDFELYYYDYDKGKKWDAHGMIQEEWVYKLGPAQHSYTGGGIGALIHIQGNVMTPWWAEVTWVLPAVTLGALPAVPSNAIVSAWCGFTLTDAKYQEVWSAQYNQSGNGETYTNLEHEPIDVGLYRVTWAEGGYIDTMTCVGMVQTSGLSTYVPDPVNYPDRKNLQGDLDLGYIFRMAMDNPPVGNEQLMLIMGGTEAGIDGKAILEKYVTSYRYSTVTGGATWDLKYRELGFGSFVVGPAKIVLDMDVIEANCPTISQRLPPYSL